VSTRRIARGLAFVLLAVLLVLGGCGDADEAPNEAREDASAPPGPDLAGGFAASFDDVTARSGVAFTHRTGATGEKLLPETMGSGACLFDMDSDGALDLFLVNSAGPSALFAGRGDGTFADVSAERGADVEPYGMGAAAADFDGDGDRDLYVTALREDLLLVNEGGAFVERAEAAGLVDPGWTDDAGARHPSWSTASTWLDFDADGDVDLFVGGYCKWTRELEIFTTLDGVTKAFTTPDRYQGLAPRLYANDGDGTFTRVRDPALSGAVGKTLGVAVFDLEDDGVPEILVANDTRPNFLLRRTAGGAWIEEGARVGIAYDENGRARAGMGIDVASIGGVPWLAIGNFAGEPMSLFRLDAGFFRPAAAPAGVARPTTAPLAFGVAFADLDLDGALDLAVVNGHIEPDIARMRPAEAHAQAPQAFRGDGAGRFADVGASAGDLARPRVGRGLATGDLDGDGDLDLVLTQNGGPAVLLANRARETARDEPPRFLRVRVAGKDGAADALGTRVTLHAGGRAQRRDVRTGSSYLSQSETTLTFGLPPGVARASELELEVRWPSGRVERRAVESLDTTLVLREP